MGTEYRFKDEALVCESGQVPRVVYCRLVYRSKRIGQRGCGNRKAMEISKHAEIIDKASYLDYHLIR